MAKKILLSSTVSDKCRASLEKMGYTVVKLAPFDRLQEPVSTHADMLLFYDGESIVTFKSYYMNNKSLFDGLGINVIFAEEEPTADYPHDILLNAVKTESGILFSNLGYTSQKVKERAKRHIQVKQGYTACSTCKITDNAFVTSDIGLYKAYTENGIDCLYVEKEGIALPGYDVGFIGGAACVIDGTLCFFGNAEDYPEYEKIRDFAKRYNIETLCLSDEKLTDVGGGVLLNS